MTFLEIQKLIELRARYKEDPDVIKSLANRKLRYLVGQYNNPLFHTALNFPTNDDQLIYDLAANVRKVTDLRTLDPDLDLSAQLFAPEVSLTQNWREAYDVSQAVDPATNKTGHIIILENNPGDRTVAAGNNLVLYYYRHPTEMTENTDVPEFPLMYHELIALAAAVELHENKFGSSPLEEQYFNLNQDYLSSVQKEADPNFNDQDICYNKEYL